MKKIILLLAIIISTTSAQALEWKFWNKEKSEYKSVFKGFIGHARLENAEKASVKEFLNKLEEASNSHDLESLKTYYSKDFRSMDGFGYDTFFTMVEETFKVYTDITYNTTVKSIDVYGDWATIALHDIICAEVANPNQINTKENMGKLEGVCDYVLYLKQEGGEWKVISDHIIAEETSLKYGEARGINMKLGSPLHIDNGQEYTISFKMDCPKDTFALASLDREVIMYPPNKSEESFRKLPLEGILERIVHSPGNGLNEYAIASVGLTRLYYGEENDSLGFKMSGLALLMKRINVR